MTIAKSHELPSEPAELADSAELWAAYELVEKAGLLEGVTLEQWRYIPEDFCRDHELDNGRLVARRPGSLPAAQTR